MPQVECPACKQALWLEVNDDVTSRCFHCGQTLIRNGDHYVKAEDLFVHDDLDPI